MEPAAVTEARAVWGAAAARSASRGRVRRADAIALLLILATLLPLQPVHGQEPLPGLAPADSSRSVEPDSPAGAHDCAATTLLHTPGLESPTARFVRLAETLGRAPLRSRLLRRSADQAAARLCADAPWRGRPPAEALPPIRPAPVRFASEMNTAYPIDRNNGGLWAGRGWSAGITAGLVGRVGPVSAAVQPVVTYQENRSFETVPTTRPGHFDRLYPGHVARIDWPQRFGRVPYWRVHPGPSYLRVDIDPVAAGFSTENLWWGPAHRYPILLSNTAPGFAHAFLRTRRPIELGGIADIEAEIIWGRLDESAYFDADAANDRRSVAGGIVTLSPAAVDGLWAGAARIRVTPVPADGRGVADHLLEPVRFGDRDDHGALELSTLFARWVLPESGFEVYGEVALPDYEWGRRPDRGEDRGAAFAFGATKAFALDRLLGGSWIRLHLEMIDLQNEYSLRSRGPTATYYVDPDVTHGYAHQGQLLGAAIGPGSEAQILSGDLFWSLGSVGLFVERVGYDDDAYYERYAPAFGMHGHDLELALGFRQTLRFRGLEASWSLRFAERRNRSFIPVTSGFWAERNTSFGLDVAWTP